MSDGNADFGNPRNRIGAFQGEPAPAPDTSWPVPGEVYRPNPEPIAGPGELAPCDGDE